MVNVGSLILVAIGDNCTLRSIACKSRIEVCYVSLDR